MTGEDALRGLATLVADEPGILQVLGRRNAVLSVPEPARALVVAGLARRSSRRPILVATPTAGDAETTTSSPTSATATSSCSPPGRPFRSSV